MNQMLPVSTDIGSPSINIEVEIGLLGAISIINNGALAVESTGLSRFAPRAHSG